MRLYILIGIIFLFILLPLNIYAATHYVSATGTDTWANSTNIATPCSLSTANTNAAAGDIVYLRVGTYTITSNGIAPTNSGTAGNVITYSAYTADGGVTYETVTITGAADITGVSSRGISYSNDSYIKVTHIIFSNLRQGFVIDGGGHNEIAYCNFTFRNHYDDVYLTGTADSDSIISLIDAANDFTSYGGKLLVNLTDGSLVQGEGTPEAHQYDNYWYLPGPTYRSLSGGSDNSWDTGDSYKITAIQQYDPGHCSIEKTTSHNWIHHNVIHGGGALTPGGDEGCLVTIENTSNSTYQATHNTFEYNHFYHGGHHVFAVNSGTHNVIRKNYMHNEGWYEDADECNICSTGDNGVCGYRVVYSAGSKTIARYALYEGNVIGYGAQYGRSHPGSGGPGGGMTIGNDYNIIRYNTFIGNHQYGLGFDTSLSSPYGDGEYNKAYNNTFYQNGYNWLSYGVNGTDITLVGTDAWRTQIVISFDSQIVGGVDLMTRYGNVIKNNLFHDSWALDEKYSQSNYYPQIAAGTSGNVSNNTIENNYVASTTYLPAASTFADTADPLFVSDSLPTNSAAIIAAWSGYNVSSPDLSLQAGSPAIDAGTYLTLANGSGSGSQTLVVDDASYFQDGTWGSDLATLDADWIAIGTVTNYISIVHIDYTENEITLSQPKTWSDNDPIWLYKNSSGNVVLYGTSPDYGAHEYVTNYVPPNPVIRVGASFGGGVGIGGGGGIIK